MSRVYLFLFLQAYFFSRGSLGAHSRPKTTALARCNFVGSLLLETLVLADQILYARLREPNPSGWRHFVPSGARLTRSGLLLRRTSFGLQCSTARANVIAFSLRNNVCGQASKHDLHCIRRIRQKKPEDAHVRCATLVFGSRWRSSLVPCFAPLFSLESCGPYFARMRAELLENLEECASTV